MSDHEHQQHHSDSEEDSIMEDKEKRVEQSSDHESVRLYSLFVFSPLFVLFLYPIRVAQQLYLH